MKLHPDKSNVQTISAYGDGWIAVDGQRIDSSVIVGSGGQRIAWPCRQFSELDASHFAQLAELDTELVIFGSGSTIRFPKPAWLQPLMQRRLGIETMDTHAACRTYNILSGEGRKVVVALLIEGSRA
jgi:uncharacterized protein